MVDGDGEDGLDLEVATAEGEVLYEAGFDGESDTGEIGVASVDIDEDTGEVTVDVDEVVPAAIDDEVLAVTEVDEPAEADSSEGTIAPADSNPADSRPDDTNPTDSNSTDDTNPSPNTDVADSPDTTRATAPPDTDQPAPVDTDPPATSDAESGGDD